MNSQRRFTATLRFVQNKRNLFCAFSLLTIVVCWVIHRKTMQFESPVNIYRTMKKTCKGTLELQDEEIRKKISSYEFPGTDKYIRDLFPTFDVPDTMPDFPHFVTALSSSHYQEGLRMIYSLYAMLGERYPYLKLYVYDIGLSKEEQMKIREVCNCTFRIFPFDQYPEHVRILLGYAWKPLIIQLMIREHPFVVWLDASIRFTTTNIDPLLNKAKRLKALSFLSNARVAARTVEDTFELLKEEPCLFKDVYVFQACAIILYPSAFEMQYLLKPWVACALVPGCMVTFDNPKLHIRCTSMNNFGCHRFDQAIWSILMNRLYHKHAREHFIDVPGFSKRCETCGLKEAKKLLQGHSKKQFKRPVNIYRTMNKTCKGTLELSDEEIRKKISSYEFPGTDKYIRDLFPTFDVPDTMPDFPHFVTALSSSHYQEGLRMIYSLYAMLGESYPYLKLYVYDIGLSKKEQMKIREVCNCTFRIFPFDQYPEHVRILLGYAWKPLIIQLMIKEHPFVVWLDASIRFTTTNIDPLLNKAKRLKALSFLSNARVAARTVEDTFELLKEEPCLFKDVYVFQACAIILYPSAFEMQYLLKPWVACALVPGCMVTFDNPKLHIRCTSMNNFGCHRFDQAIWSILMNRLYHKHAREHFIDVPGFSKRCETCGLKEAKKLLQGHSKK